MYQNYEKFMLGMKWKEKGKLATVKGITELSVSITKESNFLINKQVSKFCARLSTKAETADSTRRYCE